MNTLPLNKDRIVGQKTPLQISYIWGIRIRFEQEDKMCDRLWTVSYEAVIWSISKYLMWHIVARFPAEQRCCNRKPIALCNLR